MTDTQLPPIRGIIIPERRESYLWVDGYEDRFDEATWQHVDSFQREINFNQKTGVSKKIAVLIRWVKASLSRKSKPLLLPLGAFRLRACTTEEERDQLKFHLEQGGEMYANIYTPLDEHEFPKCKYRRSQIKKFNKLLASINKRRRANNGCKTLADRLFFWRK